SVQRVAGLRLRAGLASPAEEIRSQVLVDVAEVEREHTEHELATARVALHASAEEASLLRARVLPGVERALEIMRRGYESGRFAQIEVLDAERARIEAREQYLRALTEAHHSAQEIERLTGVALEVRP
ncbi:MAG TPA: TolC family protein, partial [Myxococcota bacterium]|nr:TolC family protein [Myxococcota bacterium]